MSRSNDPNAKEDEQGEQRRRASEQMILMMEQGRAFSGHEPNCCFLNLPGGRFATISAVSGLDFPDDGRAVGVVDWDQDGDLDLWISNRNAPRLRLMRNESANKHHFLTLRLVGNGKSTNRDAIGARVEVVAKGLGGKRLIRTVRAGEGFLAQSSKSVTIGIGSVEKVDKVLVRWPHGELEEFRNVKADHLYRIVQGSGEAIRVAARPRPDGLKPAEQELEKHPGVMRIPLVTPTPMPRKIAYSAFDGSERQLRFSNAGKPTLIVLWASWCLPCWKELEDLANHYNELQSAGIDVVALAVDGLGDDRSDAAAAQKLSLQLKLPFTTGKARAEFVQLMTAYHNVLVAVKKLLPVPSSFLIDSQGRLSIIYKGRVNAGQLLKDSQSAPRARVERWRRAAFLPGRTIEDDGLFRSLRRIEAATLCAWGNHYATSKQFADAIPHFRGALEAEPEFGLAHQGLAQVLVFTAQHDEAGIHFEKALQQFPKREYLHHGLGGVRAQQGRWKDALVSFEAALAIKSSFWEARVGRANALMNLNRRAEAAAEFRAILRINPRYVPARQALMQIEGR